MILGEMEYTGYRDDVSQWLNSYDVLKDPEGVGENRMTISLPSKFTLIRLTWSNKASDLC